VARPFASQASVPVYGRNRLALELLRFIQASSSARDCFACAEAVSEEVR